MFLYCTAFFSKHSKECICFVSEIVATKNSNNKKHVPIFILLLVDKAIVCNALIYKDGK